MGKVIIITGASGDMGSSISETLAQADNTLILVNRKEHDRMSKLKEEIQKKGGKVEVFHKDLSISSEVKELFQKVKEKYGDHIDVLINNAGVIRDNRIENISDEDWDVVVKNNLYSVFYCMREAMKIMKKQEHGRIINISSTSALIGNYGQANYVASKAGILGLTRTGAVEGGKYGIRVNAICPGLHYSKMIDSMPQEKVESFRKSIPLKYIGSSKDVADMVKFLVSDEADYITGQTLCVNGGLTM